MKKSKLLKAEANKKIGEAGIVCFIHHKQSLWLFILALLFFIEGCASFGRFGNNGKLSGFETDNYIQSVENIVSDAEFSFNSDRLEKSRNYCDEALRELFKIKNLIDGNEYERLHSQIAIVRVKTNQSRHSKAAIVKSDLFPLVWNSRVEKWINYYTGRGRPDLERCVERSGKYIEYVKRILNENGMPNDLIYVPIVESGYYPFARSRAGAVGLWQFMKTTAKLNGLKVDYWFDERRDPYKATRAAAKVLKKLYEDFGTWELALAAYNYGSNGVKRRIKKWSTEDYWELYLPRETENFVPKIMAVIFILREPELFGFKRSFNENNYTWKEFKVTDSIDLRDAAKWSGADIKEIQMLNPELMQMCTPPEVSYTLKIPGKAYETFLNNFASLTDGQKYLSKKEIDRRIRRIVYYKVRKGDSIWKISRKFKVSMKKIKKWNNLTSNRIYPRQKLKIYRHGI